MASLDKKATKVIGAIRMVMEMVILQINPETSQVLNQVMVVVMALVILVALVVMA